MNKKTLTGVIIAIAIVIILLILAIIFIPKSMANNTETTAKPGATLAPEASLAPDVTGTPEATATAEATATPEITATPEATVTSEVTASPVVTASPKATASPLPSSTPMPTATPQGKGITSLDEISENDGENKYYLKNDITTDEVIEIKKDDIVIDLNGKKIAGAVQLDGDNVVLENGKIEVTGADQSAVKVLGDDCEIKNLEIKTNRVGIYVGNNNPVVKASADIRDCNITSNYSGDSANNGCIEIYGGGTANVYSGTYIATNSDANKESNSACIKIAEVHTGTLNIYGGTFKSAKNGGQIWGCYGGTVNICGGNFDNTNIALRSNNTEDFRKLNGADMDSTYKYVWIKTVDGVITKTYFQRQNGPAAANQKTAY